MKSLRRVRLVVVSVCLCVSSVAPLGAQAGSASPPPQQPVQQQKPPATPVPSPLEDVPRNPQRPPEQPAPPPQPVEQQKPPAGTPPTNPLEGVPQAPTQQPQLEVPKPAPGAQPNLNGQVIEAVEFRGARRVPPDTLKALIVTKNGDLYSDEVLRRDFMALWNTGRFDDIRLETEPGREGVIVRFVLTERRVIRSIDYVGIHSVTVSEILDRFKERKVGLTVESQYDPNKVQRAAVALKEYLAERGHQYATVDPVLEQVPPASLSLKFMVNEGPKVKVGHIEITGNQAMSTKWGIRQMKNLKPFGIPYSIFFENLFAKTFDTDKLDEDKERLTMAYRDRGFFAAKTLESKVEIIPRGGRGWRLPLIHTNAAGIYADFTVPVEEGRLYHLRNANFVGVKVFREPLALLNYFNMKQGDVFSTDKLRKGLENLRKVYGMLGYIDFIPEPDPEIVPDTDQVDLTLTADEGRQFFVRRIDFAGNTTTRDKVIRREILLDEGDIFNTQLWDYSILRLNQLGYFEMIKKEESMDGLKRNSGTDTVDITLKVKERGKNSIGLNGGVSGIAGSFVGFNYSTNNFLGLGETLSLEAQLGTLMRNVSLGFTEPYFLDRPLQLGFVVFLNRYNFDQGRQASILSGQNLIPLYNQLGTQNLLNYIQNSHGFNVSASYPLRRVMARFSLTYGYDISTIKTETTAAVNYFQYLNFSGVAGPNALNGIHTSTITPSYQYNTVNHPINPTGGKSLFISTAFAGSVLGGNVNTMRPSIDAKYYHLSPWHKTHVLAFHLMTSMITGYGGKFVPPFSRTFMGGEQDVRGFDWFTITPVAFIPTSSSSIGVLNADGTARMQKVVSGGTITNQQVTMTIPSYQLITPGGDTQVLFNFEYRIPIIANTVTLAPFFDGGLNKILRPSQLTLDASHINDLNSQFPQAAFQGPVKIAPGTQKPRASTGLELQVMLPVVQAPFRVYFAYNPSIVRGNLQPPIVADRSYFPNNATFLNSIASYGQAYPYNERRTAFRFTIGRTF